MSTSQPRGDQCPHCGNTDLLKGVRLGYPAETGLMFRRAIFWGIEPLYVDLCQSCGSVARLYVKETNRNWRTG